MVAHHFGVVGVVGSNPAVPIYLSSSFISDLYSLYELMPTAINVKEEKKAKTNIVRFETSTSPNWKDIKMFIRKNFF